MITGTMSEKKLAIALPAQGLLAGAFLFAFASYLVTPYLSIFFKNQIGLRESSIGFVIGSMTLIQFGGGLVGGIAAERIGLKTAMLTGICFRIVGLLLLATATVHRPLLFPAIGFLAFAPALYLPSNRAYLISETVEVQLKARLLSLANSALNAGMSLGPLVAAGFFNSHATLVLIGSAFAFTITAPLHFGLREVFPTNRATDRAMFLTAAQRSFKPLLFSCATYYTYFYFQSFMALYATDLFGARAFSWLLFLNFLILIAVQPLAATKVSLASYRSVVAAGFTLMGLGFLIMSDGTISSAFGGTAVMTLGQAILFLRGDLEVLESSKLSPAVAFGLQRLTIGVGGAFGSIAGGFAFEFCRSLTRLPSFWLVPAAQAFVFCFIAVLAKTERS